MRYHINDNNEVKRCRAKSNTSCGFYRGEGSTPHFDDPKEAQKVASRRQAARTREENRRKEFEPKKAKVANALQRFGGVDKESLPVAKNEKDIVNLWFNGREETFKSFMEHSENDRLNASSKEFLGSMMIKGLSVSQEKKATDVPFDSDWEKENNVSHLTIIDEGEDKDALDLILSGKVTAFAHA